MVNVVGRVQGLLAIGAEAALVFHHLQDILGAVCAARCEQQPPTLGLLLRAYGLDLLAGETAVVFPSGHLPGVVPSDVAHWLTRDVAVARMGHVGGPGLLTTPAPAMAVGDIGALTLPLCAVLLGPLVLLVGGERRLMAPHEPPRGTAHKSEASVRLIGEVGLLPTTTHAFPVGDARVVSLPLPLVLGLFLRASLKAPRMVWPRT